MKEQKIAATTTFQQHKKKDEKHNFGKLNHPFKILSK